MKQDHLDEGLLARFLDSELSGLERTTWSAHLKECASCQAELERLRLDSARLTGILTNTDVPVPSLPTPVVSGAGFWNRTRGLMAAAATGVLLLGVISPTRAWIVNSFQDAAQLFLGHGVPPVQEAPPDQVTEVANEVRVSIPISGDVLTVQVATRQAAGVITFQVTDDPRSFAQIVAGGQEELVVSDGLRIVNRAESTASYVITVPTAVSVVRLVVGSEAGRRYDITGAGHSWVVTLGMP